MIWVLDVLQKGVSIALASLLKTRPDHTGRGGVPSGSLHRPMVSVGPGEQGMRLRRRFSYDAVGLLLFDNSVDCTRQPENEIASTYEMDEAFIRRVVRNP